MILSKDYTGIRVAVLTDDVIDKLLERYPYIFIGGNTQYLTKDHVRDINNKIKEYLPGKEDLVTEWVLSSLKKDSGIYPEDLPDFINVAAYYFDHYKEPKFKKAVEEYQEENQEWNSFSSKNILTFTLHDLYEVIDLYAAEPEDPKVNQLSSTLPEGSSLFFNNGKYQIIQVNTPGAACQLGKGTKWCTSNQEVASDYLSSSPLYIFYQKGKKIAQLHIGKNNIQFMDIRDRTVDVDHGIRDILVKSGLMSGILKVISNPQLLKGPVFNEDLFVKFVGEDDDPYIRGVCSKSARLAYLYALHVIRGRFQEAEKIIAENPTFSLYYAAHVIKGRFLLGEPTIYNFGSWGKYESMLEEINPHQYQELVQEKESRYPDTLYQK